jgi:hypothetical protein
MKLLPHLPAFETQDLRPADIVRMGIILFGSVALSLVVVAGLLSWMRPAERPVSRTETEQLRAGPRLQLDDRQDARQLEQAAARRLQGYAWTDRKAWEVHIPIDRAIELLARQGWPDADTGGSKP